jgi:uncharacterized protein YdeI (YjbR/CyaY-like superfamily)
MSAKKKFRGVLERSKDNLGWTVVRVPFDAKTAWKERRGNRVKGSINGFAFRTSLFGTAEGQVLLVNKQMQKGGGVTLGGSAEIVLEPDLEERVTGVPAELAKILRRESALKKFYDAFSQSTKDDIARTIAGVKSAEARVRRVEQMAERMMLAMEGERELPPLLVTVFRRYPKAMEGWKAMTPVQRRGHLLGVFHYQSPESREKRAVKAAEDAVQVAKKKEAR